MHKQLNSRARRSAVRTTPSHRNRSFGNPALPPIAHPSWFGGEVVQSSERIAPDQFWARLGL